MKEHLRFMDIYLRTEGWSMLCLTALWLFIAIVGVGLSLIVSWPAMKIFYGALFEVIF